MTGASGLTLGDLVRELPAGSVLEGDPAVKIHGVHQDSRRVNPGDLFVARRGASDDGARFIDDALARGATALLTDTAFEPPPGVPCVQVADPRIGLALAAAAVYGHPSFGLDVIGVTGTNGKTTTTHLVRAAIDGALGRAACGVVGTVGHAFGSFVEGALHTTPEADDLARTLQAMQRLGASHVAMEVSSIALTQKRVHAIRFRVAVFTNLTQDHLDFHGSMAAYGDAKAELFTTSEPASAVIHVGDPFGRALVAKVRAPVVRVSAVVGAPASDAEVAPVDATLTPRGIAATVRTPKQVVSLTSPLFGAHNLENLLVALGVVVALDLDVGKAVAALGREPGVAGRLERCESPDDDIVVLVDYAHTPDALARVLASVRAVSSGRLAVVFGCGGDRDRMKRAPMGEAAGRGADVAIVTNDNPRSEPPEAIALAVVEGLRAAEASPADGAALGPKSRCFVVELDRQKAIELAVLSAAPGDTVVVCGKGHEAYQEALGVRRPFDDRVEVKRALARRRTRRSAGSTEGGA